LINKAKVLTGADEFLPLLIYTVIKSNPKNFYSNVEYITAFRAQSKMLTELGYYFTNIVSAVTFIQNIDHSHLTGMNSQDFALHMNSSLTTTTTTTTTTSSTTTSPMTSAMTSTMTMINHFAQLKLEDLKVNEVPMLLNTFKDIFQENLRLKSLLLEKK
jgi:hypothetical protein